MPVPTSTTRPADPVKKIMATNLAIVGLDDSLLAVAQELTADEIGVVLVGDGRRPIGLISERDLVTVFATGGDLDVKQAADVMTADLVVASPDDSIAAVGRLMVEARIRHVVIHDAGTVVGVVSLRDVLAVCLAPAGPPAG